MAFTFFFRDRETLGLIEEHVIARLRGRRYMDIWDAGCAHGPEPYSLAILLRENMGEFLFRNVRIYATDINGNFGETIRRGTYPDEQVRRVPADLLRRYFVAADEPRHFVVAEPIRRAVHFSEHDLTSLEPIRDGLALILCKNVLLHLAESQRCDVIKMFHDALAPGGFLAMEQTQEMPEEVEPLFVRVTNRGQLFRREER